MDELSANDFFVADEAMSDSFYQSVMAYFHRLEENEVLKRAGIGTDSDFQIQTSIRGDLIYWLDEEKDTELAPFFAWRDELISRLRRYCFLSLSDSEFHLAKYPAGTHYERHIDQFGHRNNRQITILLYLNNEWKAGDGGELKIYRKSGDILIEPIAKRLLVFKSDTIEHEVLTTNIPRYSLTGWLLHKPAGLGNIL